MAGRQAPPSSGYGDRIARTAAALHCALPEGAAERLGKWLTTLSAWNERLDLTAARDTDELLDLMLADAFVLARETEQGASVIDVGSGAGAPGLALALARPDLRVTLAEPKTKRVAFLRTAIGLVSATNVTVMRQRGEEVLDGLGDRAPRFDVAVARAVLAPGPWLALGAQLINEGGTVWVMLAKESPPALAGFRITKELVYTWPLTGVSRRAVAYARSEPAAPFGTAENETDSGLKKLGPAYGSMRTLRGR